jgi:HEAT repeat protein
VSHLAGVLRDDKDANVRVLAAEALATMKEAAVGPLISALGTQDITLRMAAVKSLGELGDTRAAAPLLTVLKGDKEPEVRAMAASALAKIKHDAAVEPLIDALKASDGTLRTAAVESLGEFADKRAVRPLIAVLKEDGDPKIRHSAAQALVKMNGVAVEPLIEPRWNRSEILATPVL